MSALTRKMPPSASTNHSTWAATPPSPGMSSANALVNVSHVRVDPARGGDREAAAIVTTRIAEMMPSQPTRAGMPRDIVLSNQ